MMQVAEWVATHADQLLRAIEAVQLLSDLGGRHVGELVDGHVERELAEQKCGVVPQDEPLVIDEDVKALLFFEVAGEEAVVGDLP